MYVAQRSRVLFKPCDGLEEAGSNVGVMEDETDKMHFGAFDFLSAGVNFQRIQ